MYAPYYPPSLLVQGNCDDLFTDYTNCKFAYSEVEENTGVNSDSDTDIIVIITLLAAVILLFVLFGIVYGVMRSHRYSENYNNPRYSSTSTIVATGNEHRPNYSTVQQVSVSPNTQSNHEPERMHESPQKPLNNQENYQNYSPYQHAQPSYYSLNDDQ